MNSRGHLICTPLQLADVYPQYSVLPLLVNAHAPLQVVAQAPTDSAWDPPQKAQGYQHQSQFCWIGRRHRTLDTSEYSHRKNKYESLNIQLSFAGLKTDTTLNLLSQEGARGQGQAHP